MSAVFVTATGTDMGKTFVAAGLIRRLRASGRQVEAVKPVASGFDPAHPQASDAAVLLDALGQKVTSEAIARVSPWRFRAPLSPDIAARREGRALDFAAVVEFSRQELAAASDLLLIEGIGGVMVPLDDAHTVLDWMAELAIPALLVAGSYLGTISHTLTALGMLGARGIAVGAVVVSESLDAPMPLDDTVAAIARFAPDAGVIGVPRLACGRDHPAFADIAHALDGAPRRWR